MISSAPIFAAVLTGERRIAFEIDDNGILVRTGDKGNQSVAPNSMQERIHHINHYSKLSGHRGGRKLYYRIRKDFYWPSLAVYCYTTVWRCPHWTLNRIKLRKKVTQLQLFPETAPLTSVVMDILGNFIRTRRKNKYLLWSPIATPRWLKRFQWNVSLPQKSRSISLILGYSTTFLRRNASLTMGVASRSNAFNKYVALWKFIIAWRQHSSGKKTEKWSVRTELSSQRLARTLPITHEIGIFTLMC